MSLFLKVFLWFWLATVLVIGALAVAAFLTRTDESPRAPLFVETVVSSYGRNAAATYERGGAGALGEYLRHVEGESGIEAHLFGAGGADLAGEGRVTDDERELAARVLETGGPVFEPLGRRLILEARPVESGGGRYAFVVRMPLGKRGPGRGPFGLLTDDSSALVVRLLAVVLTAGLLCYLLARYIVSPVVKLREVTRQVSRGDLSARVGPLLGKRRDELAAMGRDFDVMAAQVEALMSAQRRLLRDISHELRSPLARLSVALDLARKRAGPEAASALSRIEMESARLNEMIGQLLTLSRWEAGPAQGAPLDLAALIREVVEDADFEARGQDREVKLEGCEACETLGAAVLLRSAFENVVRNAVRHAPTGTAVRVSLVCRRDGGQGSAVISVRDEGPGVPEEALEHIFRPFYRVDDARDRETGGTGLGLAITERAVRLHGGTVTAANIPGGGFLVEISLPLSPEGVGDKSP